MRSFERPGYSYNRGSLEFNLYKRGGSWNQRLVLPIAFEQYLYGLGEMPSSWPAAALRAQAVAGRTFATYKVKRFGPNRQCNCDITDGANDQVYVGYAKEAGTDGNRWVAAVNDTRGQVVTHNGNVIQAFYAASDGGHSDSVEDVWHGGNSDFAIAYLKAECDPGEDSAANPWTDWQKSLTAPELTSRLAPYTGSIGTVRGFGAVRRGAGGRIIRATVRGRAGSAPITGSELRWAIGAWDGRIWINENKNITGPIRTRYDAVMCRPGLPTSRIQSVDGGSRQQFKKGAIFRTASADVTVWLRGPVYREYRSIEGPNGPIGMPVSQIVDINPGGGTRSLFERGRILGKRGLGTHALWGRVLAEYLDRGGDRRTARIPDEPGPRRRRRRHAGPLRARHHRVPRRAGVPARLNRGRSAVVGGVGLGRVRRAGERTAEPGRDRRDPGRAVTVPGHVCNWSHAARATEVPSGRPSNGAATVIGLRRRDALQRIDHLR